MESLETLPPEVLQRLKYRYRKGRGPLGDGLKGELARMGYSVALATVRDIVTVVGTGFSICDQCMWKGLCGDERAYKLSGNSLGCLYMIDRETPVWKLNVAVMTRRWGEEFTLIRFEGGLLTVPCTTDLEELLGDEEIPPELHLQVTDKKGLVKAINALLEISRRFTGSETEEDSVVVSRLKHRFFDLEIIPYGKPVNLEFGFARPFRKETLEQYLARIERIKDRCKEIYKKKVDSLLSDTSVKERIMEMVKALGQVVLLNEHYQGDLEWFAQDFWPSMTLEEVDEFYARAAIAANQGSPEDHLEEALKQTKGGRV